MKNAKRFLALVLSFLMVFTSVPMNVASATEYPGVTPTRSANYNAYVGDTHDFHLYVVENGITTKELIKLKADETVIWESSNEDVFTIEEENYETSEKTYEDKKAISKAKMLEEGYLEEVYSYKFDGRAKNKIYNKYYNSYYNYNSYYSVDKDGFYDSSKKYYIKISNGQGWNAQEPTYREISLDEMVEGGYAKKSDKPVSTKFTKEAEDVVFAYYYYGFDSVDNGDDYSKNATYYVIETNNYKIAVGNASFIGAGTAELTATTFDAEGKAVKQTIATIIVEAAERTFKNDLQLSEELANYYLQIVKNDFNTEIYEAEYADVEKMEISDFVKETFENEDYNFTLSYENSDVDIVENEEDEDSEYVVVIKPAYEKVAKPCHEVIVINYIQGEAGINGDKVSRNEILDNPSSFDIKGTTYVSNVDYTYDKDAKFDVKKYIKVTLEDAIDKAHNNVKRDYVLDTEKTKVVVGDMDADTRTRVVEITPWYNRVKVTVNFVYENQTLYTKTMPNKVDNKLTRQEVDAAKKAAEALNKNEATEVVKFKHFVDKDGKVVKDLDKMTFTEDTTFTAVYEVIGKTFVKFGYYDNNEFVQIGDKKLVANDKLNGQNKEEDVKRECSNEIGNKVVKEIKDENNEITVVYATLQYTAKFFCDGKEVKEDKTVYTVVDLDTQDQAKEDEKNANKIIEDNKLSGNFTIENTTDVAKYKNFKVVEVAGSIIKNIELFFTKGLVNPIKLQHILNFHDVAQNIDEVIEIKDAKYTEVEKENDAKNYEQYAEEGYVLDKANLGKDAIEVKDDKVVFNYRARLIKVFYNFVDEYGKKVTNEDVTSPEYVYVKFNAYDAFSKESMDQLVKDMAKEIDKYDFVNGTAQGDAQYRAKALDAKETDNYYPDYNVINVNLTYQQNKQAFCAHKYGYVDNGTDHSYECLICGLIGEEGIAHEAHEYSYTEHECKKCGHVQEGVEYKHSMNLVAGLTYPAADGALTIKSVNAGAIDIADDLNDSDERAAYIENEKLDPEKGLGKEKSEDIAEAILEALENGQNLSKDEEKNAWIVKNVMYQTNYDIYYNMTITLKVVNGTFKQVELKNTPNFDNVVKEVVKDVMRQKSEEGIKLPEDGRIISITLNGEDVKELAYGNVYDVIARFGSLDDRTEISEFTGKVHLYHQSSKKKKTNTIKVDDPLPLAGGAIADLRNNRPNDMLTRSEFVGVLAQILPVLDGGKYKPFEDISGDANELSIKKYSTFEIVKGYCDEEFGPNDFITREQMYLILARAIKFSGKATDLTEDQIATELAKILNGEKVSEWATEGVAIAIQKGLTSDANEDPQGNIMRAQAADKLEKFVAIIATTEEEPKLD